MKKKLAILLGSAMLMAAPAATAFADVTEPGTPGDPNCHGQTIAYLAQVFGFADIHGIGNLAKALGWDVKAVQELVDSYCG